MTTNQTERVSDDELDQMIWKLERDGMTPKQLSLMRELREVRRAKCEPVAWDYEWASCITCEGPQDFKRIIEREAPPEWAIEEGQARNIIPLHTVPSAPVVPDLKELEAILDWILMLPCPTPKATHFAMRLAVVIEACRAAMFQAHGTLTNEGTMQLSGNSEQPEPVSNRDELKKGLAAIRNSGIAIDGEKILAERDALNSPATSDGWIPVSERMPGDTVDADGGATCYLVFYAEGRQPNGGSNVQVSNVTYLRRWHEGMITHWMPLPAAPKEVG